MELLEQQIVSLLDSSMSLFQHKSNDVMRDNGSSITTSLFSISCRHDVASPGVFYSLICVMTNFHLLQLH